MLVRDVMTQPVITIPADLACTAAGQRLVGHGFTAAPVVNDDGALIGNPG